MTEEENELFFFFLDIDRHGHGQFKIVPDKPLFFSKLMQIFPSMPCNGNLSSLMSSIRHCSFSYFNRQKGFTLLELIIVVAIIGTLAAIAVPNFISFRERAKYAVAIAEIRQIETQVNAFFIISGRYPVNLAEVGLGNLNDPWGTPYQYLDVSIIKGKGPKRKDRNTNPVNNDFDLYSMGPDRKSKLPFTVPVSFDDVVRANDGAYLGLVSDY